MLQHTFSSTSIRLKRSRTATRLREDFGKLFAALESQRSEEDDDCTEPECADTQKHKNDTRDTPCAVLNYRTPANVDIFSACGQLRYPEDIQLDTNWRQSLDTAQQLIEKTLAVLQRPRRVATGRETLSPYNKNKTHLLPHRRTLAIGAHNRGHKNQ